MTTYALTCPDSRCSAQFSVDLEPQIDLADGGNPITCPRCREEWEWDYDLETDSLELIEDSEDDEAPAQDDDFVWEE